MPEARNARIRTTLLDGYQFPTPKMLHGAELVRLRCANPFVIAAVNDCIEEAIINQLPQSCPDGMCYLCWRSPVFVTARSGQPPLCAACAACAEKETATDLRGTE